MQSKNLGTSIYMTDWQYLSVNSQKSLIIIMTRTLKPFEYKINHTVLSLDLFTAVSTFAFVLQKLYIHHFYYKILSF